MNEADIQPLLLLNPILLRVIRLPLANELRELFHNYIERHSKAHQGISSQLSRYALVLRHISGPTPGPRDIVDCLERDLIKNGTNGTNAHIAQKAFEVAKKELRACSLIAMRHAKAGRHSHHRSSIGSYRWFSRRSSAVGVISDTSLMLGTLRYPEAEV